MQESHVDGKGLSHLGHHLLPPWAGLEVQSDRDWRQQCSVGCRFLKWRVSPLHHSVHPRGPSFECISEFLKTRLADELVDELTVKSRRHTSVFFI